MTESRQAEPSPMGATEIVRRNFDATRVGQVRRATTREIEMMAALIEREATDRLRAYADENDVVLGEVEAVWELHLTAHGFQVPLDLLLPDGDVDGETVGKIRDLFAEAAHNKSPYVEVSVPLPQCPSVSPEGRIQCRLPDTARAHWKGHEAMRRNGLGSDGDISSWKTNDTDRQRWTSSDE